MKCSDFSFLKALSKVVVLILVLYVSNRLGKIVVIAVLLLAYEP